VRSTWAEIDLSAVEHNIVRLRELVAPAALVAVVKADGYGHGAVAVAEAALAAGAVGLAVALVEEGATLRAAGVDAPVLLLAEPPPSDAADVVAHDLQPAVYTEVGIIALADAVACARSQRAAPDPVGPLVVHLKVDTGMHRVGVQPAEAVAVAKVIGARTELRLGSVWTHCAVADEPDEPFTAEQLDRFARTVVDLAAAGVEVPARHAANSAAAIAHPEARLDLVRCGIAIYGIDPSPALAGRADLCPALRLVSRVSHVKVVAAGEALSYGQRYRLDADTVVATIPIGYADGLRRRLSATGATVLVHGRRRPVAGTVTMDQITVDCGDDHSVSVGDEVVLIGHQGDDEIPVSEWAERLDTIGYEIVCGIGPRVPRTYTNRGGG